MPHLALGPGQDDFVNPIHDFVENPRDQGDFHVVRSRHEAVGFCKADRNWHAHFWAAHPGD